MGSRRGAVRLHPFWSLRWNCIHLCPCSWLNTRLRWSIRGSGFNCSHTPKQKWFSYLTCENKIWYKLFCDWGKISEWCIVSQHITSPFFHVCMGKEGGKVMFWVGGFFRIFLFILGEVSVLHLLMAKISSGNGSNLMKPLCNWFFSSSIEYCCKNSFLKLFN